MNSSLARLEFDKVLQKVASLAGFRRGAELVKELLPGCDPQSSLHLQRETLVASELLNRDIGFGGIDLDPLGGILDLLKEDNALLEPSQLRITGMILREMDGFAGRIESMDDPAPDVFPLKDQLNRIPRLTQLHRRLLAITTEEGELSPGASREYGRLLREVDRLKRRLSQKIRRISSSLSEKGLVRDMPPTLREGRYVLPVIASRKGQVPGIVHDRSESGETLFIEPSGMVEEGNSLRELSLDLDYERRRILRDNTLAIRDRLYEMKQGMEAVAYLDAVYARARYHMNNGTVFPAPGRLNLVNLAHPLIPKHESVTNTVSLPDDWRVLLISGPNAGGKSVLLKAVGLAVACVQSGIGCLAGAGSTIPQFRSLHVSIGDQQSIAMHQSTYSARLMEQREMMESVGGATLALIDEPAAGTDPLTGTALAAAVLEELAEKGCRVIVTTHQGQLKSLAQDRGGFYSGCMNFQSETLQPDYTFTFGIPGSSFTLEIARRMDFPEDVLSRAQNLSGDSFKLDRMLEETARDRRLAGERLQELQRREEEGRRGLKKRETDLKRTMEELEETRSRIEEEHREFLRNINSRADSLLAQLAKTGDRDQRRELRREVRELTMKNRGKAPFQQEGREDSATPLQEGDWVSVKGWNGKGRVEELGSDWAAVRLGNLKLRKPLSDMVREEPPEEERDVSSADWSVPVTAETRLDLRGMSSEEALAAIDDALDDAMVAGVNLLTLIHGKGKGILMKAVIDMARRDSRIGSFRQGRPPEGGTGVTIVTLAQGKGE